VIAVMAAALIGLMVALVAIGWGVYRAVR